MPAPNFLPGLVIQKQIALTGMGEEEVSYVVNDTATINNLQGLDENGKKLPR